MADDMPSQSDQTTAPESGQDGFDLKYYVPQDLLDVSFPVAVRGYERSAVDAYIQRINRVIAELKVRSSPPAAVRHAVEEAEGTVQGLLQAAREAAEQITASAQREAEEHTASAKAEAAKLTVDTSADADRVKAEASQVMADAKRDADESRASAKAEAENIVARAQAEADERLQRFEEEMTQRREDAEARMRKLQADTNVVWDERRDLLEDIRSMSSDLVELANAAATRIKGEDAAEPERDEAAVIRAAVGRPTADDQDT
jgi:DivIVA domain-containing protein